MNNEGESGGEWVFLGLIDAPADGFEEKVVQSIAESFKATGRQVSDILVRPNEEGTRHVLVAGRNRLEAARRVGWEKIRATILPYATEDDRLRAELLNLDENDARKDIKPVERSIHALRRAEIHAVLFPDAPKRGGDFTSPKGKERAKRAKAEGRPKLASEAEAAATGVSQTTAKQNLRRGHELGKDFLERIAPYRHLNVGKELDALVDLSPEHREEVVKAAENGSKLKATTKLNQWQRDLREMALAGKQKSLPDKRYGVVYADPPWRWEAWSAEGDAKAAENHYPTMTLDEIRAMPVADTIAAPDCVLYLWARNDMLDVAIDVGRMWGFQYKSSIIWDKVEASTGYWVRTRHEHLLIFTRGKPPAPAPGTQPHSIIEAMKGKHSAKPENFRKMIERFYPNLPKIELFQRDDGKGPPKGWSVYGLESSEEAPAAPAQDAPPIADVAPGPASKTTPARKVDPAVIARLKAPLADEPVAPKVATSAFTPEEQERRRKLVEQFATKPAEGSPYSRGPSIAKPTLPESQ